MITGERQAAWVRGLQLRANLRQGIVFFDKGTSTREIVYRLSGDTILIQDAMGNKVNDFQLASIFDSSSMYWFLSGK